MASLVRHYNDERLHAALGYMAPVIWHPGQPEQVRDERARRIVAARAHRKTCPAIAQSWRRNWEAVIPFFAFSPEVRKIIYTTNAIESLNASVRKAVRNKGHFPTDLAATKLIWLALRHITEKWKNPPISWHAAKAQLAIQFEDRFVLSE